MSDFSPGASKTCCYVKKPSNNSSLGSFWVFSCKGLQRFSRIFKAHEILKLQLVGVNTTSPDRVDTWIQDRYPGPHCHCPPLNVDYSVQAHMDYVPPTISLHHPALNCICTKGRDAFQWLDASDVSQTSFEVGAPALWITQVSRCGIHLKGGKTGLVNLVLCVLLTTRNVFLFSHSASFSPPSSVAAAALKAHHLSCSLCQSSSSPASLPLMRSPLALVFVRPPCPSLFSHCDAEATAADFNQRGICIPSYHP